MKKLLGTSLLAIFAATQMMANAQAADVDKSPTKLTGDYVKNVLGDGTMPNDTAEEVAEELMDAVTAADSPKYGVKTINANDGTKTVTAGYVKGAYNAAIKGVNALHQEVENIKTNLNSNYATQDGLVATIKQAGATATLTTGDLSVTSVSTNNVNLSATGGVTVKVKPLDDWDNDTEAQDFTTSSGVSYTRTVTDGTVSFADASVSGSVTSSVAMSVDPSLVYHAPASN